MFYTVRNVSDFEKNGEQEHRENPFCRKDRLRIADFEDFYLKYNDGGLIQMEIGIQWNVGRKNKKIKQNNQT